MTEQSNELLQDKEKLAFTIDESHTALGVSRAYLYRLIADGELKSFSLGRRRLVSRQSILNLIARREAAEQREVV